jgi:flagellar FliJ protein
MRGFRFRLQSVLDQRQKKEDILKKELAEKKMLFEREKAVLEQLKSRLSNIRQEFCDKQKVKIEAHEAAAYSLYFDRVEREIEFQLIKLTEIASEVKKAQERLLEAAKDKKIIEKLYDKQLAEYRQEMNRTEQALIDEISTVRYKRADV